MSKLFAVETRNMHNAGHEIFIFKNKKDAKTALDIFNQIDSIYAEGGEGVEFSPLWLDLNVLWEELNDMDYENRGVNFRWRHENKYKLIDGRIVEVINPDNVYDIY